MTLSVGDHVVIKRDGQLVDPQHEGHIEFEVVKAGVYARSDDGPIQEVSLKVVEYTYADTDKPSAPGPDDPNYPPTQAEREEAPAPAAWAPPDGAH